MKNPVAPDPSAASSGEGFPHLLGFYKEFDHIIVPRSLTLGLMSFRTCFIFWFSAVNASFSFYR